MKNPIHLCEKCGGHGWLHMPGLPPVDVRSKQEAKLIIQNIDTKDFKRETLKKIEVFVETSQLPERKRRRICRQYGRTRRNIRRAMLRHARQFERLQKHLEQLDTMRGRLTSSMFQPSTMADEAEAARLMFEIQDPNYRNIPRA